MAGGNKGHRQRLKERFLASEPRALTEWALLELLLTYAIPQKDVQPLAQQLIAAFGSLGAVLAADRSALIRINDGVRVNVAPLQLAGVLAAGVLKEPNARKAIADRARWRADERRWVRQGVLPRCGWMGDAIPESPRWTERAPERAAEAAKLARKRAEALAKLEER